MYIYQTNIIMMLKYEMNSKDFYLFQPRKYLTTSVI